MIKNSTFDVFIDSNDEIDEHMIDKELIDYIKWSMDDSSTDLNDAFIKKLKVFIFDYDRVDTLCYDLDLTYMEFIDILCRTVPFIMTPHISKQIRDGIDQFKMCGVDDEPEPNENEIDEPEDDEYINQPENDTEIDESEINDPNVITIYC